VFGLGKVDEKSYSLSIKAMGRCNLTMKIELRAGSDQEVKTACFTILLNHAENGLQHVFEKWVERCKKFIECQGRYFEKETVTAPPQSFYSK
jgi:hypothetical protein